VSVRARRILLLGGNGQLGRALRGVLAGEGELLVASRDGGLVEGGQGPAIDLERAGALNDAVRQRRPQIVVNAAAYTAVDRAEDEPERAMRINAEAPAELAEACRALDAWLVHYSTDYVFDGRATRPWREGDAANPLGVYGTSKLAGERAIQASGVRHSVLRTAWVFAAHGHNFLRTILCAARNGTPLRVVADQRGTPTSVDWIAAATRALLRRGEPGSGLWHLTAAGETTWHGFATAILEQGHELGLLPEIVTATAIATADWPTRAARPAYSVLDSTALMQSLGLRAPPWQAGVRAALEHLARTD
jgi:dTDP-4-dehydrorhamnose reductase